MLHKDWIKLVKIAKDYGYTEIVSDIYANVLVGRDLEFNELGQVYFGSYEDNILIAENRSIKQMKAIMLNIYDKEKIDE